MADYDNTAPVPLPLRHEPWPPVKVTLIGASDPASVQDGSTVDGVVLNRDELFLCGGSRAEAGIYKVSSSFSTRSSEANSAGQFITGRTVRVEGGSNAGTYRLTTTGPITLGTTPITFEKISTAAATLAAAVTHSNTPPGTLTL